jgi:hypothetical protein
MPEGARDASVADAQTADVFAADAAAPDAIVDATIVDAMIADAADPDAEPVTDAAELDGGFVLDADVAVDAAEVDAAVVCDVVVAGVGSYCSISEAVAAAPAGATINVPSRTFTENVVIAKSLHLFGAGGTSLSGVAGADAALTIVASDVEVANLDVIGATGGIEVGGGAVDVSLHDLRVAGTSGFGIAAGGASVAIVQSVTIEDIVAGAHPGYGVGVDGAAQVDLLAVTIRRTASDGVHVESAIANVFATRTSSTLIELAGGHGIYSQDASARLYVKPNPDDLSNFNGTITVRTNGRSAIFVAGGYARIADNTLIGNSTIAPQDVLSFNGSGEFHTKRNAINNGSGYGLFCDPTGTTVDCDSNDPNTYAGNALGATSPACPAACR